MTQTLSIHAADTEIKNLIVEWCELLAAENYKEALSMFAVSNEENSWTPALLKECINGYGVIDGDAETLEYMLDEYEVKKFKVSSLLERDDKDKIIEDSIDVDRKNLFGLDPKDYVGMVHFEDIPLSGYLSDLTAQFHLKKINSDEITLEFLNIHIM